jgi:hypothetical protein
MMARWEARGGLRQYDPEVIKPYLTAEAATMRHALAALADSHGSVERYVLDHGLTADEVAHLRAVLVDPAG